MAKMHLHELLNEEQEPFVLKSYINERLSQLKRPVPKTHLQLKRRTPISQSPTFARNLYKTRCFFPSNTSKSSPLFDFPSPAKSPCRKPNNVAALILEAAFRIQKPHSSSSQKQKTPKNLSFGFLASILKRISLRKKTQKREICREEIRVSVKDILRWDSFHGLQKYTEDRAPTTPKPFIPYAKKEIYEMGFSFSCESTDWSEDFEEKSMDLESSCSGSSESEDFEEMEFGGERKGDSRSSENGFCSSPLRLRTPEREPNHGFRTPEFSTPASSPFCRRSEVIDGQMFQNTSDGGSFGCVDREDEEEKDQFSPVSVLDPPFEDDEDDDENEEEDDEFFEQSFANVQRAKQNLLGKLRRFESLSELDPLELEKRITEEEEEEYNDDISNRENEKEVESLLSLGNEETELFVREVHSRSSSCGGKFPANMKRLVLDIAKEETDEYMLDTEVLAKVCKRIESWKEVALNTIDMTVESDFKTEGDVWRRNHEEVRETAAEIELALFGFLVEELSMDLVRLSSL